MSLVSDYDHSVSQNARSDSAVAIRSDPPTGIARAGAGREELTEQEGLAAILVRLLHDAGEAIYRDRDAAQACITRASALLRAQRGQDDASDEHGPVKLVRGGLAPWQILRIRTHIEAHLDSTIR